MLYKSTQEALYCQDFLVDLFFKDQSDSGGFPDVVESLNCRCCLNHYTYDEDYLCQICTKDLGEIIANQLL